MGRGARGEELERVRGCGAWFRTAQALDDGSPWHTLQEKGLELAPMVGCSNTPPSLHLSPPSCSLSPPTLAAPSCRPRVP